VHLGPIYSIETKEYCFGTVAVSSPGEALVSLLEWAGFLVTFTDKGDIIWPDPQTREICGDLDRWIIREYVDDDALDAYRTRKRKRSLRMFELRELLLPGGKTWTVVLPGWMTGCSGEVDAEMGRWPCGRGALDKGVSIHWGYWVGNGDDAILVLDGDNGRLDTRGRPVWTPKGTRR
jgi:hypothetical protein